MAKHPTSKSIPPLHDSANTKTSQHVNRYLIVGLSLTLFNYLFYILLANIIINNNDLIWLSTLISTFFTTVIGYYAHSRITWKERHITKTAIYKFFIWNAIITFAINPLLTQFFSIFTSFYNFIHDITTNLGLPFSAEFIITTGAFVFTAIITTILNFFFYDRFVFGKKQPAFKATTNRQSHDIIYTMAIPNFFYKNNRVLLKELTKTDFKLRYQGSVLGYLWALLRPLLMFAILYIVFAKLLKFGNDIPHYPVYLLVGTTFWSFFTECTSQGIQAIVNRGDLLRKVCFPKYIVVVSATLTAVINVLINLIVIFIFALIDGVTPSWTWLLVPALLFELYLFALGISFLLGAINVKYRDITSIWDVFIQALFYAVPIIYPITMVAASSQTAAKVILLNPIAQVIQDLRYCIVTKETITTWNYIGEEHIIWKFIPIVIVVFVLTLGSWYFRKKSKRFAEEI